MKDSAKIAIAIPCFKVKRHIADVLLSIPSYIDYIIVVDDECPDQSGDIAMKFVTEHKDQRIIVVKHQKNKGVGGAIKTAYLKALNLGVDIVVKIDGDGQMDLSYLDNLLEPILSGKADYTKGNRFRDFNKLKTMPVVRLFGNSVLSFLLKVASGYWNIMDPTNGYTAIHKNVLLGLPLNQIADRYFFESDMLINLNIIEAVVQDVDIPAKYGDEESSLSIWRVTRKFPFKLLRGFLRRIFLRYYIRDFNMLSVYLLFGFPMIFWGFGFGLYKWIEGIMLNELNTTGTVMLAVLPLILGTQFILQAIQIDINSVPKR